MILVSRSRGPRPQHHRAPAPAPALRGRLDATFFRARLAVAAALLVLGVASLSPTAALAEEPFRVGSQIEDRVGALDDRHDEVEAALDELEAAERVQLWLVYVDTFSGLGAEDWAYETAVESDLGLRDVLLAVAVEDRAYAYSVDDDFPLTQSEMDEVMVVAVEPALSENDWAGAAVGAATGMGQALGGETVTTPDIEPGETAGGGSSWGLAVGVVVLLLVAGAVVWVFARRGRARRGSQTAAGGGAEPALTLEELRRRAGSELVETDDAVKTSTQELGFAVAQFGDEPAAPFAQAVDEAKRHLDEAFRLHQEAGRSDDEQRRRELLAAVLEHTAAANEKLDAQAERFDKLRDLEHNAPEVLAAVEKQAADLEARLPAVRQEQVTLAATYAPAALAAVSDNVDEAASRLSFARQQVQAGREDLEGGRRGEAAVAADAAQEAAAQAAALLDAVGRLGRDLSEVQARIAAAIDETRRDIAEARAAAGAGAPLAPLVAAAETAVAAAADSASPAGGHDPLAALRHVEEADAALEKALEQVRDAQAQRAKAAAALERTVLAARAEIGAASDYITTHRGGVGGDPRAALAEAQRHLDQAVALGASDPVTALRHASHAHEIAGRALGAAQAETRHATTGAGMPGRGGGLGDTGRAILGGLIVSGMLRGGGSSRGGAFGGGRRSGGGGSFGRPSFGGSGTRMRRGGGGRF